MARGGVARPSLRSGAARIIIAVAFAVAGAPAAVAHAAALPAHTVSVGVTVATQPALAPAFDPSIADYIIRCEPSEHVRVTIGDRSNTAVVVDGQPVARRSFSTRLKIGPGQGLAMRIGAGRYEVRCLPPDFPGYTAQAFAQPQAAYYLLTPSSATAHVPAAPYVALFDAHGVPVWWYRESAGAPVNAALAPGGLLTWDLLKYAFNRNNAPALWWQVATGFGLPSEADLVEHGLDGSLVRTLDTAGTPTDFHEGLALPNGDFLLSSYGLRPGADLEPVFASPFATLDAIFEVVNRSGTVVSRWDSAAVIAPAESQRASGAIDFAYPGVPGPAWDEQHLDSVDPFGDGYLVSLAHTDAVYLVRASDGAIEFKLGGTPTAQSLTIVGDPLSGSDFGSQSDARGWSDGTVSVLDNGTGRRRAPRVLRFRIDPVSRQAILIQTLTDPLAGTSSCCGSARVLPGGDWVVDWGGSQIIDELTPSGQPVLRLTLAYPYDSYRAVPVLPGQLSASALQAGMDAITPRTASGSQPPPLWALSAISPSAGAHRLRIGFRIGWGARVRVRVLHCRRVGGHLRCSRALSRTLAAGRGLNHASVPLTLRAGTYRILATPIAHGQSGATTVADARLAG